MLLTKVVMVGFFINMSHQTSVSLFASAIMSYQASMMSLVACALGWYPESEDKRCVKVAQGTSISIALKMSSMLDNSHDHMRKDYAMLR